MLNSDAVECLLHIGDDVVGVFKTDGETDETCGNACRLEIFGTVGGVGHGCGMLNKRLGVAEGDCDGAELESVAELHACFLAALYLKGDHAAEVLHLTLCDLVTGMRGQTGVVDVLYLVVVVQVLGDLLCACGVTLYTDLKRLETSEDEP